MSENNFIRRFQFTQLLIYAMRKSMKKEANQPAAPYTARVSISLRKQIDSLRDLIEVAK